MHEDEISKMIHNIFSIFSYVIISESNSVFILYTYHLQMNQLISTLIVHVYERNIDTFRVIRKFSKNQRKQIPFEVVDAK